MDITRLITLPKLSLRCALWLIAGLLFTYTLIVLYTKHEFSLLLIIAIVNLVLIPNILERSAQHQLNQHIERPEAYVRFENDTMFVGNTGIELAKINKVALEVVNERCYFSLPFNPTSPGQCPAFTFAASQRPAFQQYLRSHMKDVEILV
ncbi:MAG: hypothetical protein HWE26_00295 [Alteromonadaceae bacterium]|nr:hypothetical protein [Alteromonadaceae bacterium]